MRPAMALRTALICTIVACTAVPLSHAATAPDTQAPSPPTNLRVEAAGPSRVDLSWSASTDNVAVTQYIVRRSDIVRVDGKDRLQNNADIAAIGPITSYSDTTAKPGSRYSYKVRARDAAGNDGGPSAAVSVSTPTSGPTPGTDTQAPTSPTALSARAATATRVDLTWTASTDDVAVTRYAVRRDGREIATIDANATSYSDTSAQAATTYVYTLLAQDAAGNVSPPSNGAQVTTPTQNTPPPTGKDTVAPTAPTNVRATATSATRVTLSWSASTDNVGVTQYIVRRSEIVRVSGKDSLQNTADIATIGPTTSYSDTSVKGATRYSYKIRSKDAAGNTGIASVPVEVTTPAVGGTPVTDTEPPTAPTNLAATVLTDRVSLSWNAATDNIAVARYVVRRNDIEIATVDATTTTYADTSVAPQATYRYTLVADDAAGNRSVASNAVDATTPARDTPPPPPSPDTQAPTPPTALTATIGGPPSSITLNWNAATDNVGVTMYIVRRSGVDIATIGPATTFTDTTVSAGTSYSYKVRARDAAGNSSGPTNEVRITTPFG